MKFGDYLRRKREDHNWTQPEAAVKAGIEQSYLSKLETGKSYPSAEIFERLKQAYELKLDDLTKAVSDAELDKLKDVPEIRNAVLARKKTSVTIVRGWLAAGLVCLMIGAGSLGLVGVNSSIDQHEFRYRSMGILLANENLNVFDIVAQDLDEEDPDFDRLRSRQQAMIDRIDEKYFVTTEFRGEEFVENTSTQRRVYNLYDTRPVQENSVLRWFFVPAFMFLAGSIGCFYIAFRWKP
ncbi:helix-turn-helix transcriptional regulator [Hyphococcus flavus]|uniref:Helix-turn-helix transcriptional regulator n=1 Tax=Hyphococcus flavus TaxID=1866326 RepID=A0AAE9ZER8_9PROT|nr:helix-turn-helix transcriptional regulator [Hyphococcus flavus]WDI31473.1 helix-turn-helix transcriptional regulator [Hyphococcus flavus]